MRVKQIASIDSSRPTSGALHGLRVVELGGIGPIPHAGMWFVMLGAEVVRIERPAPPPDAAADDLLLHGRTIIRADLKSARDRDLVLDLIERADVVLEGFRPGVTERMGLGPADCHHRNGRLVYGRMTGWGQTGPYAQMAGHDINYLGLTGALHAIGDTGPIPPLNLVGDFGGGSMFLIAGVLAALWERERSGLGQVVDAAIVDGTSVLMQLIWSELAADRWFDARRSNLLDGAAPFYRAYECADGRHVAVGAIEPEFYQRLLDGLGLAREVLPAQDDRERWPQLTASIGDVFLSHPRDHWSAVFDGTDACVTPILSLHEVSTNDHMAYRKNVVATAGKTRASAAPHFDRSTTSALQPPQERGLGAVVRSWTSSPGVHHSEDRHVRKGMPSA